MSIFFSLFSTDFFEILGLAEADFDFVFEVVGIEENFALEFIEISSLTPRGKSGVGFFAKTSSSKDMRSDSSQELRFAGEIGILRNLFVKHVFEWYRI